MGLTRRLLLPALVALAMYYAVFGGEYSVFDVRRAHADRDRAEEQLVILRAQVESLRARADSLDNDPGALERIAREKFGMIREGEVLYRVVPPAEVEPPDGSGADG